MEQMWKTCPFHTDSEANMVRIFHLQPDDGGKKNLGIHTYIQNIKALSLGSFMNNYERINTREGDFFGGVRLHPC